VGGGVGLSPAAQSVGMKGNGVRSTWMRVCHSGRGVCAEVDSERGTWSQFARGKVPEHGLCLNVSATNCIVRCHVLYVVSRLRQSDCVVSMSVLAILIDADRVFNAFNDSE